MYEVSFYKRRIKTADVVVTVATDDFEVAVAQAKCAYLKQRSEGDLRAVDAIILKNLSKASDAA